MDSNKGWIGVDLDGTLAEHHGPHGPFEIGKPIPQMVDRVKKWLSEGRDVRIFTARVDSNEGTYKRPANEYPHYQLSCRIKQAISSWCVEHIGAALPVTNKKDYGCVAIYDDRARQVEMNTGRIVGDEQKG